MPRRSLLRQPGKDIGSGLHPRTSRRGGTNEPHLDGGRRDLVLLAIVTLGVTAARPARATALSGSTPRSRIESTTCFTG